MKPVNATPIIPGTVAAVLDIPKITLPVMAGRNLAVIAEAAVRDFMLKMKGYDAASEFLERHSRLLQNQSGQ